MPEEQKHQVAYHRLRMTKEYSINPFDTQLGARYPSPQERTFFTALHILQAQRQLTEAPYDGIIDMAGMLVDEAYKSASDDGTPIHTQKELRISLTL